MGVSWHSEATIFTTQPEVIKQLIEETCRVIVSDGDRYNTISEGSDELFTLVTDLKITDNTISFHSLGYGYYGIVAPWDNPDDTPLLFEYLFNNYDEGLVCHEVVRSCQDDEFCFSVSWTKHEGDIDWEDGEEETYSIISSTIAQSYSDLLDDFDCILVWSTHLKDPAITPSLKKLIKVAKEQGFTDWASEEELEEFYYNDESITFNTIEKIENYLDRCDDLILEALLEAEEMMINLSRLIDSNIDYPNELNELVEQHNKKFSS